MIYSITEGQQAEEYKARKAKEAEDTANKEAERNERRYSKPAGVQEHEKDGHKVVSSTNAKRAMEAQRQFTKEFSRRYRNFADEYAKAAKRPITPEEKENLYKTAGNLRNLSKASGTTFDNNFKPNFTRKQGVYKVTDAIDRHIRRHPEQYKESCGIFYTVTFI